MKKILFSVILSFAIFICLSQTSSDTIYPYSSSYTGYADYYGNKTTGDVKVGAANPPFITNRYRGFMKFSIPITIPNGSTILGIELHFFLHYAGGNGYTLWIGSLLDDPMYSSGTYIYSAIGSGYTYYSNYWGMESTGWKTIYLNSTANYYFQNSISMGWWAVGLMEQGDDDAYATAYGYGGSYEPYCVIQYNAIPTVQASNISFYSITQNSMDIHWNIGNGSKRVVFMKQANTGTAYPINNMYYSPSTIFGQGSQTGGWYCIYNGYGSGAMVTGLVPNTEYRVHVCEYNGIINHEQYNTYSSYSNPSNQFTSNPPTIQATNIITDSIAKNSFFIQWTNGSGSFRVVFMTMGSSGSASPVDNINYSANQTYGLGSVAGSWYCVYDGSGSAVSVSGLSPQTTYRIHVCEYNIVNSNRQYLIISASGNPANQSTCPDAPSVQASNIGYSIITADSVNINWTNGNGINRAVFMRSGLSNDLQIDNGTTYTADYIFGNGSSAGSWYCVYNGSGSSLLVTGLSSTQVYIIRVCEYNGSEGCEQYLSDTAMLNPSYLTYNNCTWTYKVTDITHLILIPGNCASINGTPVNDGDFIGVFYNNNGNYECGGYIQYFCSDGCNSVLFAYGDDMFTTTDKDGFAPFETLTWKIWKSSAGEIYSAIATYQSGFPSLSQFEANGISAIDSLYTKETQTVSLPAGWSFFSTYIDIQNPDITSVLSGISPYFVLVKNGTGKVYWPQYNVNTIVNMETCKGYQILMNTQQNLFITGPPVIPELTTVALAQGWDIIAYLRKTAGDVEVMFSSITSNLIIAKSGEGNVYWPQYDVNTINDLLPGKGYQLKCSSACNLVYPPNSQNFYKNEENVLQPVHYTDIKNTGNNMTLGIEHGVWGMGHRVEVGIFSQDGLLVGAGVQTNNFTAITIWGDDELTPEKDGMNEGEPFELRLWDALSGIEIPVKVDNWLEGSGYYQTNGISIAGSILPDAMNATILYQNIPNPCIDYTEIRIYLPESENVDLSIVNQLGENVATIYSGKLNQGSYNIPCNTSILTPGIYLYRLKTDRFDGIRFLSKVQ